MKQYKRVLTIAGSDPSGGAGIQADVKTISACGCFATTAITAIVDENTLGVYGVHPIPNNFVKGQIKSVLDDIGSDAIKIGMLHDSALIMTVKNTIQDYHVQNIVVDPVMVATSGDKLLQDEAISILQHELIPLARIITPNIPEAEILSGKKITGRKDLVAVSKELSHNGTVSVLLKAGHLTADILTDVFYNAEEDEIVEFSSKRVHTHNTHGTGCTFSSAIASFLALQFPLNEAVRKAKDYINQAIIKGANFKIGKGHGPVHHFHGLWKG